MAKVPPQLTPLKGKGDKRSDDIRKKLKGVKSEKKKFSRIYEGSKIAKCKNCKLDCDFREAALTRDPESICVVPSIRAGAIRDKTRVVGWDDNKVRSYMEELLKLYTELCLSSRIEGKTQSHIDREKMRRLNTVFSRLKDFKELMFPPVQRRVSVNIDMTADKVVERIKHYKIVAQQESKKKKKKKDE